MQTDTVSTTRASLGVMWLGLVGLSALALIGAAVRLLSHSSLNVTSWTGVLLLATATLLVIRPGRSSMSWARVLCLVVLGVAVYTVADRMFGTVATTGINERLSDYWSSLFPLTRALYEADALHTHIPLSPGMLGQAALLLLLATLGAKRAPATV